jgi:pimeloyl-ACP methyl ester carboxylesterase
MATRAARLGPDHVRALNAIDIVFYGQKVFGRSRRTKSEQAVLDAWREYLDKLSEAVPEGEAAVQAFLASRNELFINLLAALAKERRYAFDRVTLKKGAYSPNAHNEIEQAQFDALKGVGDVFNGRRPLQVAPAQPPQP